MIRAPSRPAPLAPSVAVLAAALATGACEVQWGGGRVALEDPSPPQPEAAGEETEAPPAPLPDAPLLYFARLRTDGAGVVAPIARLGADSVKALDAPRPPTEEYRERFEAAFLQPGTELALVAGGRRIGSLVVGEPASEHPRCLFVSHVQAILPPGAAVPEAGFALPLELAPERIGRVPGREPTSRMTTFGPVLAEQLLRADGIPRPYLAQRMSLAAVAGPDTALELAATYLINDSLRVGAPQGEAVSLFYLARREPTRGYVPVWREVRAYAEAGNKEAMVYVDWLEAGGTRFDFVNIIGGTEERLSVSRAPPDWRDRMGLAERRFEWVEPAECPAVQALSEIDSG